MAVLHKIVLRFTGNSVFSKGQLAEASRKVRRNDMTQKRFRQKCAEGSPKVPGMFADLTTIFGRAAQGRGGQVVVGTPRKVRGNDSFSDGQGAIPTLSHYCPHTVLQCPHNVPTLSSHCPHAVPTLSPCCPHAFLMLSPYYPHSVSALYQCCSHTVPTLSP